MSEKEDAKDWNWIKEADVDKAVLKIQSVAFGPDLNNIKAVWFGPQGRFKKEFEFIKDVNPKQWNRAGLLDQWKQKIATEIGLRIAELLSNEIVWHRSGIGTVQVDDITVPLWIREAEVDEAISQIQNAVSTADLKDIDILWFGRQGRFKKEFEFIKDINPKQWDRAGLLNQWKVRIAQAITSRREVLAAKEIGDQAASMFVDTSMPGLPVQSGHLHPLTVVTEQVVDVFERMGFYTLDYPEAESEFFNFDGLNIPSDHPARDTQDTFYLTDGNLLRTHTSPGQVRAMKALKPPFKAIFPGRVFRCEATDASHEHTFHQVEGIMIDRSVSVANLISSMMTLLSGVFGRQVTVRLRPGFFPFVEPGFELDIQCMVCGGAGCPVCKRSGWVELMPCGLIHPNVLRAGGLDPAEWEGWAFGLGLSRLVMMRYEIDDIRWLLSGDLRFVRQF